MLCHSKQSQGVDRMRVYGLEWPLIVIRSPSVQMTSGVFSLRDFYEQLTMVMKMGPLGMGLKSKPPQHYLLNTLLLLAFVRDLLAFGRVGDAHLNIPIGLEYPRRHFAGKVMGMIPGMAEMMPPGSEQEGMRRFKRMMTIMDSMTNDELDSDGKILSQQVQIPPTPTSQTPFTRGL